MTSTPSEVGIKQSIGARLRSAVREWLLLSETRAARSELSGDCAPFEKLFRRAEQRVHGAQSLWREGAKIDAFAMLDHASDDVRAIAEAFPTIRDRMGSLDALARDEKHEPFTETLPSDAAKAFSTHTRALLLALARARPATVRPWKRLFLLVSRWSFLLMLGALAWSVRDGLSPRRLGARASATWGLTYAPPFAVDRDKSTHWLLPDGQLGWLQVSFTPKRVRVLRIWQPQGMPMYAVNRIRVEYMLGTRVVRTESLNIRSMIASPQPVRIPVVGTPLLDSIKIHIEEFATGGGGFAEVEVE